VALAARLWRTNSAAAYDTQKEVTVTGHRQSIQVWKSAYLHDAPGEEGDGFDGAVEVESRRASVLNGLGFKKDSVAAGDVVTVAGNPSRNNPDKALLGKDLRKQDGTYYPLNVASRSIYVASNETATSIAGT